MSSPPPPTDGGVGGLVLEPSSRLRSTKKDADAVSESEAKYSEDEVEMKTTAHAGKKRSAPSKRKKKEEEEEEEEEDEGSEGHPSKKAKKTHRGTKITTDSDTPPVDLSSSVAALRARHDEYMELTSAKLNDILNVNLISAPKEKAKDKLAWSCVYGEIFGAPVGKCPRCLHGKLKPKLKPEQWGHKFKKGEIKWACPGYFDAETDSLKFCNKTYSMDGSEIATRKFRGLGNITEEDFKEMEDRKALERQERDILHAEHEKNPPHSLGLGHHSHPGDDRPEMVIHAGLAPRLGSEEYFPDFISDPHSTASSASPSAPHVRKSPAPDLEDVKKEHELEKKAPHLHTGHLPKEEKEKATPETAGEQVSEKGKSKNSESLSSKNRKSPIPSMSSSSSTSLPACRYGSDCFRKNPDHFLEYSHPTKEDQPHQEKK